LWLINIRITFKLVINDKGTKKSGLKKEK
jgi:hypothetical protein